MNEPEEDWTIVVIGFLIIAITLSTLVIYVFNNPA